MGFLEDNYESVPGGQFVPKDTPYEILGVTPESSPQEIKRAYIEKIKIYHPDLNPSGEATNSILSLFHTAYGEIDTPEHKDHFDKFGYGKLDFGTLPSDIMSRGYFQESDYPTEVRKTVPKKRTVYKVDTNSGPGTSRVYWTDKT